MNIPIKIYPAKPAKVYLYVTCLVNHFSPTTGMDAINLLEREGIEVEVITEQTCCGQPAYNSGYVEQSKQVALSQLELFSLPIPIVILSGSCGGMMRKHYPDLLADHPRVHEFSQRVYELSEFLLHVCQIKLQDNGTATTVTLHTSCSGRREMGIHTTGLKLLSQLSQVTVVEHEYSNECCGFGGTFSVKQADISASMVEDKSKYLSQSNCDSFVSTDWGCMLNINGALQYQSSPLRGEHLATFLNRRIKKAEEVL